MMFVVSGDALAPVKGRGFLVGVGHLSHSDGQQSSINKRTTLGQQVKMAEDESAFPRGGSSDLSRLEMRKITQRAEKDALFDTAEPEADAFPNVRAAARVRTDTCRQRQMFTPILQNRKWPLLVYLPAACVNGP